VEQRRQEERKKQELAARQRILAALLERVAPPLSKPDLEVIAREFIARLPNEHRGILNRRHLPKPIKAQNRVCTEAGRVLANLDEAGYYRLLIEIALLDCAYNVNARKPSSVLNAVARRLRVNAGENSGRCSDRVFSACEETAEAPASACQPLRGREKQPPSRT
jgi:hypothetical protein